MVLKIDKLTIKAAILLPFQKNVFKLIEGVMRREMSNTCLSPKGYTNLKRSMRIRRKRNIFYCKNGVKIDWARRLVWIGHWPAIEEYKL